MLVDTREVSVDNVVKPSIVLKLFNWLIDGYVGGRLYNKVLPPPTDGQVVTVGPWSVCHPKVLFQRLLTNYLTSLVTSSHIDKLHS